MKYTRKAWHELSAIQQQQFTVVLDRGKVKPSSRPGLIYQVFEDGTIRGFLMASNFGNPLKK